MPESHLRASDADRAAVADVLGAHMSAGRLSVAEYDERLARAYAARTYGELDELTTDLPAVPVPAAAAPADPAPAASGAHTARPAPAWAHGMSACGSWAGGSSLRAAWAAWLTTAVIVISIWLITSLAGGWVYPWPIWVIGPWGAVLLAQSVTGSRDHGRDRGRDRSRRLTSGPGA
jgi:hypothetical protein